MQVIQKNLIPCRDNIDLHPAKAGNKLKPKFRRLMKHLESALGKAGKSAVFLLTAMRDKVAANTVMAILFSLSVVMSMPSQAGSYTAITYQYIDGQYPLLLDAYMPDTSPWGDNRPAFILIHSGGWTAGNRSEFSPLAHLLASSGIVVICIDYHHATVPVPADNPRINDGRFPWPEQLNNAQAAVWWMRNHATELKINPNKIAAFGGSSGGHIASMLSLIIGYQPNTGTSSEVQALISLWGPSDLLGDHATSDLVNRSPLVTQPSYDPYNYQILRNNPQILVAKPPVSDALGMTANLLGTSVTYTIPSDAARALASPLYHIPYHVPIPTLMFQGTEDDLSPPLYAIEACTLKNLMVDNYNQLNQVNLPAPCRLVLLNGEGHNLPTLLSDPSNPNSQPNRDILINEFLTFVAKWVQ